PRRGLQLSHRRPFARPRRRPRTGTGRDRLASRGRYGGLRVRDRFSGPEHRARGRDGAFQEAGGSRFAEHHGVMPPCFVPSSTYRLQVHGGFTLTDAAAVVPYLSRIGIGAVYTSPYFAAAPGSTHGYDVTNHNEINPELGGREAHIAFT